MNNGSDAYIVCEVAETAYALRSSDIQHVQMIEHLTPVPHAAPFVEGVVFARGEVVPAVNLRKRFKLPEAPFNERTRLIVTRSNNRLVGLIVDSAREFFLIPDASIKPIDEAVVGIGQHFLTGIAEVDKRLILLFDLDAILNASDLPDEQTAQESLSQSKSAPSEN